MLTSRAILRSSAVSRSSLTRAAVWQRAMSSKSVQAAKPEEEDEDALPAVTRMRKEMSRSNPHQIMGPTGETWLPAPVLPEDPKEIAALDPADERFRTKLDGSERTVVIRQGIKSARQAPLNPENTWHICFYEDGMISQKWVNPLMGWQSTSDPYASSPPLTFPNASDAVYFAKKRGWNYVVKKPITRVLRDDDVQYQDNFLPQAIATKVQMEGTACDHWKRSNAGTSHYFRPLKYHGDGTVGQHGPNGDAKIAPHVEAYYKLR
uniref:NADH dehydrogenase [ubiquinone] iron-sulfur protein 4, mitochondrial n=1 Tax=Amphora coffeiformis TaxID=265554 RepID=A0A7S3LCR8_9STRA|mmetsp:Transcript_6642/g.13199  ORF Transcript_6642/g.13199 Transcript_6642/m.13199 type:complete len:264 (+) Transcript_6642:103-894(+)|eukprot:scaffold823_cov219-Amphora_coffeaeformis.AAC.26